MAALVAQFEKIGPGEQPFDLRPGSLIVSPKRFHEVLALEIQGGPRGARARMGSLKSDLQDYIKVRSKA